MLKFDPIIVDEDGNNKRYIKPLVFIIKLSNCYVFYKIFNKDNRDFFVELLKQI